MAAVGARPRPALALLTGGPDRMVDATVTDLVERGLVAADADPALAGDLAEAPLAAHVLHSLAEMGPALLDAVRVGARIQPVQDQFTALAREELVVTQGGRGLGSPPRCSATSP
ncbi:hypothetical protein GCM10018962_43430 [Dactylosporangium matsuzakiense]|uniref:Uncharacterized protein n=2 Tax=Dactylosporangium matsuzakiense TaxID=53360 RepID=A0A9W6KFL3_9ACTN|nr:hypothetical protein GCM10017581_015790 [Dactylosporangium matsuzakiense]